MKNKTIFRLARLSMAGFTGLIFVWLAFPTPALAAGQSASDPAAALSLASSAPIVQAAVVLVIALFGLLSLAPMLRDRK